ncbi:MAG: hypothetical protein JXA93_22040 [Anaerolineae bacterium]|nr:hypothetical protein [Anaerolineae bacterium]
MTHSPARRRAIATMGGLLLALLLAVPAIAPLTYPGFFETHSGFLPAFNAAHPEAAPGWGRVAEPIRREGVLPYLLIRPFYTLTGNGTDAVKWGYALAFLLGAAGLYAWTRRWLGTRGAVLAAAVYTYLPWHLATVYVRGAYAEAWLWAWLPLTLCALDHLISRQARDVAISLVVGLLALAVAFSTQSGLAGLSLLVLVPYGVVTILERRGMAVRLALALVLLAVLLWRLVHQAGPAPLPFADHYLYPFQLLSSHWGIGISVAGALDGLPFQLGFAAAGLSLVTVALWLLGARGQAAALQSEADATQPPLRPALLFWCAILASIVLLLLPVSASVWRITGLDALLTYPWQILALAGLPLAFLSGAALRLDARLAEWPAWAGLVALVLLASYFYLAPEFTQVDPGPEPVALLQPVEAREPQIALLDVVIDSPTILTPTLTLTLTWQAMAPVEGDYTIFVHVLDKEEKVAQQDTRPCGAECPTDTWQPGDIIVDRHQVTLPADAVASFDRLALGLYLLESGDRAAVYGQEDRTVYLDVH